MYSVVSLSISQRNVKKEEKRITPVYKTNTKKCKERRKKNNTSIQN